ncbi:MAG: hypothetical protein HQL09_02525 [Nitrospirae bacterium]|nr:hypothetical protein [Nitrospirota bacterium]
MSSKLPALNALPLSGEELNDKEVGIFIPFEIKHSIPGRLRVSSAALRDEKSLIKALNAKMRNMEGIKKVFANSLCGSITIHYDANSTDKDKIVQNLITININEVVLENLPIVISGDKHISHNKLYTLLSRVLAVAGVALFVLPGIPGAPILLLSAYFYRKARATHTTNSPQITA